MSRAIRDFYDRCGWERTADGVGYVDSSLFTDQRGDLDEYREKAETRAMAHLKDGGRLFLDAGCGAIPRSRYSKGFEWHVCVDFSTKGLLEARETLGDRGLYVLADMAALPFREGAFDGGVCAHVIYHIPGEERQRQAFREIHRTLKPGKTALVHYANPHHRLLDPGYWLTTPGANMLYLGRLMYRAAGGAVGLKRSHLDDNRMSPIEGAGEWFYMHSFPIGWVKRTLPKGDVEVRCFRCLSHRFTQRFVRDGSPFWRRFLGLMSKLERRAPTILAYLGYYTLVVINKRR